MIEAQKRARPEDRSAIVPLIVGQKMTKEELTMNRDLLFKVSEIKKNGELDKIGEFMKNDKISRQD